MLLLFITQWGCNIISRRTYRVSVSLVLFFTDKSSQGHRFNLSTSYIALPLAFLHVTFLSFLAVTSFYVGSEFPSLLVCFLHCCPIVRLMYCSYLTDSCFLLEYLCLQHYLMLGQCSTHHRLHLFYSPPLSSPLYPSPLSQFNLISLSPPPLSPSTLSLSLLSL